MFLEVPVSISYDIFSDVHNLLRRSGEAFFSNRRLLTESSVATCLPMRMFDAVVTSTLQWALGTLPITGLDIPPSETSLLDGRPTIAADLPH